MPVSLCVGIVERLFTVLIRHQSPYKFSFLYQQLDFASNFFMNMILLYFWVLWILEMPPVVFAMVST
jgi:hypothetical protein